MSAGRIALLVLLALPGPYWAAACSGKPRPAPVGGTSAGTGPTGTMGTGGEAGQGGLGSSTAGGAAGMRGDDSSNATSTSGPGKIDAGPMEPAVCGDGVVQAPENCEADVEIGFSCSAVGFETGELGCKEDCSFDTTGCAGTELCHDARDNDGDGAVDCRDADCDAVCDSSCDSPVLLEDGASIASSTDARPNDLEATCASSPSGPELVFRVTPETTGKLDLAISSRELMTVSVRQACADAASEIACGSFQQQGFLSADAVAGQAVLVVVEGYDEDSVANFTIAATSRPANQCGDGFVDELEQCDDGALVDGDGCNAACQAESNENEPNDEPGQASPYTSPTYASIDPQADVDYFSLSLAEPHDVVIDVRALASGFCAQLSMDPHVELFDAEQRSIDEDDDGGEGYCAKLTAVGLEPGQYLIAVRNSDLAAEGVRETFAYQLIVSLR